VVAVGGGDGPLYGELDVVTPGDLLDETHSPGHRLEGSPSRPKVSARKKSISESVVPWKSA
jgi:hypothetical protein